MIYEIMPTINGKQVHMQDASKLHVASQISPNGDIFADDKMLDKMADSDKRTKLQQMINDKQESLDKHEDLLKKYHEEMVSDLNQCEIKPTYSNVLIKPFDSNPFQQIKKVGNLIVDTGGYTPEYKSNDTGEWEEQEQGMLVATVVEIGPDCTNVKPGDAVFYGRHSAMPIPFYKQGFYSINEHSILQIVNVGLTERFKNYGK